MLRAYFDAGLKMKQPRVYVAGYVGRHDGWTLFNRKWRDLLRRNDLPYFHMTDYVAKQGPYKGWSADKRTAVMKRDARLGDHPNQDDRDILPDPYALCLTSCIAKTARTLHRAGLTEPVDYVFESGDAGQGTTKLILADSLRTRSSGSSSPFAP